MSNLIGDKLHHIHAYLPRAKLPMNNDAQQSAAAFGQWLNPTTSETVITNEVAQKPAKLTPLAKYHQALREQRGKLEAVVNGNGNTSIQGGGEANADRLLNINQQLQSLSNANSMMKKLQPQIVTDSTGNITQSQEYLTSLQSEMYAVAHQENSPEMQRMIRSAAAAVGSVAEADKLLDSGFNDLSLDYQIVTDASDLIEWAEYHITQSQTVVV